MPPRPAQALLAAFPPPWPQDLQPAIRALNRARPGHKLVVLDDDPTGTQTVHDVPVLTVWDEATLRAEFGQPEACFYLLTNSRSLAPAAARAVIREVARALKTAAGGAGAFTVVSRSDSTLRGHFPLETEVLTEELGPFDATILLPFFASGGRWTIDDVHYVAAGEDLIPAAETPFAQDPAFGYRRSNLREWVAEKTGGQVAAGAVRSIGLRELRVGATAEDPTRAVTDTLLRLPRGCLCVVNAAHPRDLDFLTLAALQAERRGARFLYRTAASFVASRLGLVEADHRAAAVSEREGDERDGTTPTAGGLVVVGSHVPLTTVQLNRLLAEGDLEAIELDVAAVLDPHHREGVLAAVLKPMTAALAAGRDVVVFTSRTVVAARDPARSLEIGREVSDALVWLVQRLAVRPRFLLAKGGITASDLASRALGVRRARVLGQLLPGVPVWRLGAETRFPGLELVVFPGNVGSAETLFEAWRLCAARLRRR